MSVNERDKCLLIKGSFIFADNIRLYCRILPITKYDSLFKNPYDTKIIDICKARRTSPFKRKIINEVGILKKICVTYKIDYILSPFVSRVKWD